MEARRSANQEPKQMTRKRKEFVEGENFGFSSKRINCRVNPMEIEEEAKSIVCEAAYTLLALRRAADEGNDHGYLGDGEDSNSSLLNSPSSKREESLGLLPLSDFVGGGEEESETNNEARVVVVEAAARVSLSSSTSNSVGTLLGGGGGGGRKPFPALDFLCAVRNAMFALLHSIDLGAHNFQGTQAAPDRNRPSFSLSDITDKMVELNHNNQRIHSSPNEPLHPPLQIATRGALTVLSLPPLGRVRTKWAPLTSHDGPGRWSWVGKNPKIAYPEHDSRGVKKAHLTLGVTQGVLKRLVASFDGWLEAEDRHVAALAALPTASAEMAHDVVGFLTRFTAVRLHFQEEERLRYTVPERVFFYTAVDGGKSTVSPVYTSKQTAPTRRDSHLRDDRPMGVSIISVVKDAAARLSNGEGTVRDICTLVRDSQYLQPGMIDEASLWTVVSSALNRMRKESDPAVVFVKEAGRRGLWRYLHRTRGIDEFWEDSREVLAKYKKRHAKKKNTEEEEAAGKLFICRFKL